MGVATSQILVTTAKTLLRPDTTRAMPPSASILVYNRGTVPVYIGNTNVTVDNGFQVDPDQRMSVPIGTTGEKVYALTASGSAVCHVMQSDSYA